MILQGEETVISTEKGSKRTARIGMDDGSKRNVRAKYTSRRRKGHE